MKRMYSSYWNWWCRLLGFVIHNQRGFFVVVKFWAITKPEAYIDCVHIWCDLMDLIYINCLRHLYVSIWLLCLCLCWWYNCDLAGGACVCDGNNLWWCVSLPDSFSSSACFFFYYFNLPFHNFFQFLNLCRTFSLSNIIFSLIL